MIGSRFRYFLLFPVLACLMSSCSPQEPQEQPETSTMSFSAELETRAALTGRDNLTSSPFAVFGDMTSLDPDKESSALTIHNATEVRYNPSGSEWVYDNTRLWFSGYQYSFIALHPAYNQSITGFEYKDNKLKFLYTQQSDYSTATDLMIATHRRNYSGERPDPVRFRFAHVLTNVNVKVAYNAFSDGPKSINIVRLVFSNVPVKSEYEILPARLSANNKMTSDWETDIDSQKGWTVKDKGTLSVNFSGTNTRKIEANKGAFWLFSDSDALLMLPNPDDPDDRAEIEIDYTTDTGETETYTAKIPRGWEPGTNMTLSLRIDNGVVQFSVFVEDWKTGTTTNTTVPRK